MLVELGVVEQRYRAVLEVLQDGTPVPEEVLTDNGKVFTARFGRGAGPVMFDRICADNGIRHLLTAPYSPTTTAATAPARPGAPSDARVGGLVPVSDRRRQWTWRAGVGDALARADIMPHVRPAHPGPHPATAINTATPAHQTR